MNRTNNTTWYKAVLFSLTGIAGLLIYILACVHSPVSWSPDSSKIALLVWPEKEEVGVAAIFTYNLKTGRRVVIDMIGDEGGGLSAPAWSPDGKWLAYYRIDPPSKQDPNNPPPALPLFEEENQMLPAFAYDAGKELLVDFSKAKTITAKLIVRNAETKQVAIERNLLWLGDDETNAQLIQFAPIWTPDSKSVFYIRMLDSVGYLSSIDIDSQAMRSHLFTGSGFAAISPDGTQIASVLDNSLVLADISGARCRYYNMAYQSVTDKEAYVVQWSPDSKSILIAADNAIFIADAQTGGLRPCADSTAEEIRYPRFTPNGDRILYLASYNMPDTEKPQKGFSIRAFNLKDDSVEVLNFLPEINPEVKEGLGIFSVSPDGRWLLVRSIVKDKDGNDRSSLIFCKGAERTVIETDSWLTELIQPLSAP